MNEARFHSIEFTYPDDYQGSVKATLVHLKESGQHKKAVLYIHGFVDYFFQEHVADFFHEQGFAFYALDLRKHGRSLLPHQRPNFAWDLREYYEELADAVNYIHERHDVLLLYGHSTGALTSSLFLNDHPAAEHVDALFLNSPFWEFSMPPLVKRWMLPGLARMGKKRPYQNVYTKLSKLYGMSVHKDFRGEWDYNLDWKPVGGFPIYTGWIRAVLHAQRRVWQGLDLQVPILVMHSDRSVFRMFSWNDDVQQADAVLNVNDMRKHSRKLGPHVHEMEVPGAMHDLFLSSPEARELAFRKLADWLKAWADGTAV